MRSWIDPARGVAEADVAAGIHMQVLHRLCSISHHEIRLARGEYKFEGYGRGPLEIADRVTLIGQECVVLSGDSSRLRLRSEGVREKINV